MLVIVVKVLFGGLIGGLIFMSGYAQGKAKHLKTPVTLEGLQKYDEFSPELAAGAAWNLPGPNIVHHRKAKQQVRDAMPLLARALDRL